MPREGEAPHVVMLHNRYLLLRFQTVDQQHFCYRRRTTDSIQG